MTPMKGSTMTASVTKRRRVAEPAPVNPPPSKGWGQTPASSLTDEQIARELQALGETWDASRADGEGHGGSPGEWMFERMDELGTEQKRRAKAKAPTLSALFAQAAADLRERLAGEAPVDADAARYEKTAAVLAEALSLWGDEPYPTQIAADLGLLATSRDMAEVEAAARRCLKLIGEPQRVRSYLAGADSVGDALASTHPALRAEHQRRLRLRERKALYLTEIVRQLGDTTLIEARAADQILVDDILHMLWSQVFTPAATGYHRRDGAPPEVTPVSSLGWFTDTDDYGVRTVFDAKETIKPVPRISVRAYRVFDVLRLSMVEHLRSPAVAQLQAWGDAEPTPSVEWWFEQITASQAPTWGIWDVDQPAVYVAHCKVTMAETFTVRARRVLSAVTFGPYVDVRARGGAKR